MLELHKRVATYNTVNIASIITLTFIQIMNFTFWMDTYIILIEGGDDLAIILFWPLLLLAAIIVLNKKSLRTFIHKQNEVMYQANNVNIDTRADNGSLDESVWEALPTSNIKRLRTKAKSDMSFWGTLDDIGVDYKIDDFKYTLTYRRGDDVHTAGSLKGDALVVQIPYNKFGPDWTIFCHNINFQKMQIKQEETTQVTVGDKTGTLSYNSTVDNQTLEMIREVIENQPKIFGKNGKVIALFKENKLIYITTRDHKFKIKLPIIILKPRLEKIIVDQKAQVYRFNQFLGELSRGLNV